ncbi:MAG TPA: hypothetical protein ENI41_02735 [Deltaproteobacteria bacterium]|nr:hypothetical protein [Deltaproteobacteria bacterium]
MKLPKPRYHWSQVVSAFIVFAMICVMFAVAAYGNGEVSETHYSTSLSEATGIVRIVVAVFGGLIGILGIFVAYKGIGESADVSVSIADHKNLSMKRVSQGVVITLIGAVILIGALYLLPEKKTERKITGKEVTIERTPEGETVRTLK